MAARRWSVASVCLSVREEMSPGNRRASASVVRAPSTRALARPCSHIVRWCS
ncbi:hypothetical protein [Umezawaea sp. Da 62-37]|uniref:hypothetical protein n=1 Tax=Umezawaea sp. Da 62-37 TaxID=3075927 RepID=UPI0028F73D29|nr:hypothetical protein [Umezawaea sp. Da 62-37]WNV86047.1 hypothetical protein RM788_49375 [Umezawaea sp. Da 62-37]